MFLVEKAALQSLAGVPGVVQIVDYEFKCGKTAKIFLEHCPYDLYSICSKIGRLPDAVARTIFV